MLTRLIIYRDEIETAFVNQVDWYPRTQTVENIEDEVLLQLNNLWTPTWINILHAYGIN